MRDDIYLRSLSADTAGQLNVFRHINGDALDVDGAQVGVFKSGDE